MSSRTTDVKVNGTTLTVTVTACPKNAVGMQLTPNPGIQPQEQTSGNTVTFTWSNLPNGTFTLQVFCQTMEIDNTQVTIPS